MKTIFAVSSGRPPAAIAIVRVSGSAAPNAARALTGRLPAPRVASLCRIRHPRSRELIDQALVLYFPGPQTATGEDLVEFHLHGGRAVIRAVEAALSEIPDLRLAEPGEFTRRALENGRIDLSEAEALGDLLIAETEAQRRSALANVEGAVRRLVRGWAADLVQLSADVEAAIDYEDEVDHAADEHMFVRTVQGRIATIADEIERTLAQPPVERLRDGIRVVLAGPPNSGKSSLINALAARDAAIVSPIAGTTRDRIEVPVVRKGVAWLLIDTAGLGETEDPVEADGIGRSHDALRAADLILWLGDACPPSFDAPVIEVHARSDLPGREAMPPGRVAVSALTGDLVDLWEAMAARADTLLPSLDAISLNRRQRALATAAAQSLSDGFAVDDMLLIAEHLRSARRQLDAISGTAGVEEMLDALFSTFCLGK